jgi:hypothetical protein
MTLIYEGKEPSTNTQKNSDDSFHEVDSEEEREQYFK